MATGTTYSVKFRRKRQQKTNYKRRLNLLKSGKIRFVVRVSNKNIIAQLVEYSEEGDRIMSHVNSQVLKTMGWGYSTSNTSAAYLTGILCGVKGKEKGVSEAILDIGRHPHVKGSKIYGCLKGLIDSGIAIDCDEEILPDGDRINGKTIASYFEKSKDIEGQFIKLKEQILALNK
ncbi:MAG: 50S ribosomal protein L18 [Candidatus Altiarchaeota archaeon]|nr:50S ribosomal protein L18 [Candidatus Altiarchaeota archaeon]